MNSEIVIFQDVKCSEKLSVDGFFIVERDFLVDTIMKVSIVNEDTYTDAADLLKQVTKMISNTEKMRKELQRPFDSTLKEIRKTVKTLVDPLERSKALLKKTMNAYYVEQERLRREEEARIELERREEIERQLAEKTALEEITGVEQVTELIVPEPEALIKKPVSRSVSVRTRIVFEIIDQDSLPKIWMQPDQPSIRKWISNSDGLKELIEKNDGKYERNGVLFKIESNVCSR